MRTKSLFVLGATLIGSAFGFSTASLAFCGVISKSASGPSIEAATQKANNAGLIEVRRLEKNYGNVNYSPAKLNCSGRAPYTCKITQKFCTK